VLARWNTKSTRSQDLNMSRRARIVLISVVCLVLGIELVARFSAPSTGGVQIVNGADSVIENLVVSFAGSKIALGSLAPGDATVVRLSGKENGTLDLAYTQKGNPVAGFQVADYDPRALRRDGLRLVIQIRPNEVMKYMDDDEDGTPLGKLRGRVSDWFYGELDPMKRR
jgi:hypothetical protein